MTPINTVLKQIEEQVNNDCRYIDYPSISDAKYYLAEYGLMPGECRKKYLVKSAAILVRLIAELPE